MNDAAQENTLDNGMASTDADMHGNVSDEGNDGDVPTELRSFGYIQRGPTGAKRARPAEGSLAIDAKLSKKAAQRAAKGAKVRVPSLSKPDQMMFCTFVSIASQ